MKTNANINQLNESLQAVNEKFDNNIRFKRLEQKTKNTVIFTLTVNNSKKPGSRRSAEGRRIAAACWHVHGYFFEYLFLKYDNIKISAGPLTMRSNADNWQDRNIGSIMYPQMFSDACNC
jgi:hypothetical protein